MVHPSSPRSRVASLARSAACVAAAALLATAGGCTSDGRMVNPLTGVFPGSGGGGTLITLDNLFTGDQKAQLDRLDAEAAWKKLDEPGNPFIRNDKQRADRDRIRREANGNLRTSANADVPYEAFSKLARELGADLAQRVNARAAGMTGRGALVVGKFKNYSDAGARTDGKLGQALENFKDTLADNKDLADKFRFVQFGNRTESQDLINDIGGGSDRWLKPGGENALTGQLAAYKPETIYILTGSFIQSATGTVCTLELRGTMEYPIKQEIVGGVAASRSTKYYFHPTLGWISEERNNELKRTTG